MAQDELTLTIKKFIPAPPETVFDAWTEAETLKQWMCHGVMTIPAAALDVRVGGQWSILMRGEEGEYPHNGEYRVVDRPNQLVFTWISQGTYGEESLVSVSFEAAPGGTNLTLLHEKLPDQRMADAHNEGWTAIMENLVAHGLKPTAREVGA